MNLVITGSSTGIGRSITEHLLAQGHSVWGLARSDQSTLATAHPTSFRSSRCDVSDWTQVEAAAKAVSAEWTHVDGLICAAGIQGEIGRAVTADPSNWSATVRANLDGTFYAIRAFHGQLSKAPRRAKIVCFSGGGATKPRLNFSAYGVAKTGVVRLVETIAEEERMNPLDINAIAPGAINTRLTDEVIALGPKVAGEAEYQAALKQKQTGGAPLGKAIGLVEWLLSPASDGVSGRLIAAPWDPWATLDRHATALAKSDVYTLRRIVPEERGMKFDPQ
jgi:NAD(P)-dependent dehydrogenase (short-subunit alcohol dehydrogenase family)